MGFGAYDEDEDQKDQEVDFDDNGETIDGYDGSFVYETTSKEELLDTYNNEVKDTDEEDEKDAEEEFDVDSDHVEELEPS